ncbi:MAG: hypothetical protein ABJB11_06595 [Ferruginibacter sp.]
MESSLNKIRQVSLGDNPLNNLEELVNIFSTQGLTRQNIYDMFLKFHSDNQHTDEWLKIANKFNGDHPVELILDDLSGWCNQSHVLLPNEPFKINKA